jgi:alpha-N-arabinofuranosidase
MGVPKERALSGIEGLGCEGKAVMREVSGLRLNWKRCVRFDFGLCRGLCVGASVVVALAAGFGASAWGQGATGTAAVGQLSIDTTKIVTPVSPMLYGMMTEEINHSYDGGLYAELIQNRTFRGSWEGIEHWGLVRHGNSAAKMEVVKAEGPSKALPTSLKLTVTTASAGNDAGISNTGYWGMEAHAGEVYRGSFYARADGATGGPLQVRLVNDSTGVVLGSATVTLKGGAAWTQYSYELRVGQVAASADNHFELTMAAPGTVYLQLVSLMPPTYKNRANGNRADLMERMAGMHPHFLRLPGGNYLEGDRLEDWYNWKETIGPLVDRPGHQAPWSYWSSDGLGLLEFLEWCEDLKIEPVLAVYAGYALRGDVIKPGPGLEPFVQAALDEVEYLTGDASTTWGARRAKDGHPAAFPLHYIEIGNEDWFDKTGSYDGRYAQIARALRKKYPQYKLIATTPVKGEAMAADAVPDLIDDHYYKPPAEMMDFVHHYDQAPRTGPKVFVGEWATRSGTPTPNFGDALGDAAWMTAMERNSDLILLASYAPLLVNVNPGGMQWSTDLIGFDAKTTYASPSYYAQSLFAGHLGQGTAQGTMSGVGDRFFYSATVDAQKHVLHLKLVNATDKAQPIVADVTGVGSGVTAQMTSLHGATYEATNSMARPDVIKPVESTVRVTGKGWSHTVPALTIEVLDIPLR